MHLLLIGVLAMQSLGVAQGEVLRGGLCLREPGSTMVAKHCRSVEGASFEVEPHPEERVFAWISSDQSTIALGVVPADASLVTLPEGPSAMTLEVKGSKHREWPQTTTVAIGTRETPGRWRIELSASEVVRLRTILVPPGTWDVRLKAARHAMTLLPRMRVLEPVDLGVITLEPLPQIRGTVIDREGEFIRAAVLISDERELLATSNNFGEMLYEAPCTGESDCVLPEGFRIEYPGTAPAWFTVGNPRRDYDFETLRLAKGGTLHVQVDRSLVKTPLYIEILDDRTARVPAPVPSRYALPDTHERSHRLRLRREAPDLFTGPRSFPLVASTALAEGASSARFENLPEGQLRLVLRGREQGEYLSRFFHVAPEDTLEMEIAIQPAELTVEVSLDGKDVEGVPVQVTQWNVPWHRVQTPPTGATGTSTITIWGKGKHAAQVADGRIRAAAVVEIGEKKAQSVKIDVTPASISGQVVEASTGKPLAGIPLLFEDLFYRGDFAPGAVTDDDGRFEVENVMTGGYYFEVHAEGFLPVVRGGEIKPGHNDLETVRLERGVEYRVRVLWDDGTPIPGAVFLDSHLYGPHVADENGEVTFVRAIPRDRPSPFWIVPPEGSFALGERGFNQEITIMVPRPGEKLILDFLTVDKEPVNFVHVNFTWNGRSLSRQTKLAIETLQNKRFRSDASSRLTLVGMPPGHYTFTALRSFAANPLFPDWSPPPRTTVHYSGMEQTAKVIVPVSRSQPQ
jgi:hypothetical protein